MAHGAGVVTFTDGGDAAPPAPDVTGAGVTSTPRTRPAGVRSAGIGVVSGVGGGGSGARCSTA